MEFAQRISTRRGRIKLVYKEYVFIDDQSRNDRYYWRCDDRECRGRLVTQLFDSKHLVTKMSPHNHSPHGRKRPGMKGRRNKRFSSEQPQIVKNILKNPANFEEELGIVFESKFCIEENPIPCTLEDSSSSCILPESTYDGLTELTSLEYNSNSRGEATSALLGTRFASSDSLSLKNCRTPPSIMTSGSHTLSGRTPFGVQYEPPLEILKPLSVPKKLLLGAGPANTPRRICEASAMPMLGHLHPEFLKIMDETKAGIQYAFQTKNQYTFAISGTGHCAMEASLCNVLEPGDRALIVCTGIWGERATNMAERCGAVVSQLKVPLGEVATVDAIDKEMKMQPKKPTVLFVCHGESSTGILQPLEGLGELCKKHNSILLVDTVASLGGTPVYMDTLGIDIMYSGSQKVLNAPPGISPISFSAKAIDHIKNRKTKVQSYYLDALLLGNYWNCDNQPIGYHHTGMVTLVYALREGLSILAEESLQESWKRHKENSELLYARLEDRGLQPFIKDQKHRLPTITSVLVPEGVDGKLVSEYCMKKFSLELAGGLGPTVGKIWRIGLMGCNSTPRNVDYVIRAIDEAIASCSLQNKL